MSTKQIPNLGEMMKGYLFWDSLILGKNILIVGFNISKTSNLTFSLKISTKFQKALQAVSWPVCEAEQAPVS
jgi:hypothetical protein